MAYLRIALLKHSISILSLTLINFFFSISAIFASDLPACPTSGSLNNCFGTLTFDSGDKYIGEFKNNEYHGQGTYTYRNGESYKGDWQNGIPNGMGTYTFPNGDKYIGEWKNDEYHGQGSYIYNSGDKYVGEYRNDKKNGLGVLFHSDGDMHIGEYKNGLRHGPGYYIWSNGNADFCNYRNDNALDCTGKNVHDIVPVLKTTFNSLDKDTRQIIQHILREEGIYKAAVDGLWGRGTFTAIAEFAALRIKTIDFHKRDKAEQIFVEIIQAGLEEEIEPDQNDDNSIANNSASSLSDLPVCLSSGTKHNCFGSQTYTDGTKYVGEWKNGKYHGQGTLIPPPNSEWAGDKYVGEFKNDKYHGQGTYTYSNGDKYVGEYKNNYKDGKGTTTYANGSVYIGEYKDGERHGMFTVTHANGDKYVGEYKNSKKDGQGTYTYANGDRYVGDFKDGERSGQGIATFADGDYYVGEFKNGKFNGKGTYTYADGSKSEGFFEDGELVKAEESMPVEPENNSIANNIDPNEILNAASGTGFYVSDDGHIITNYHVINGCSEVKVHAEGKSTTATILAKDSSNDLALLKVSNKPPHVFAFSNANPYPLQNIIVAGYPFGDAVSSSLKFTTGVISSLAGIGNNYSQMQIDAAIQPGNSGGPIIDEFGNIVGVAVAKLDVDKVYEDFGVIPENTNFGIKGSIAKILLESFNVSLKPPNTKEIQKSELSKITSNGTLHLSCWMTVAQIQAMQSQRVLFEKFD